MNMTVASAVVIGFIVFMSILNAGQRGEIRGRASVMKTLELQSETIKKQDEALKNQGEALNVVSEQRDRFLAELKTEYQRREKQ